MWWHCACIVELLRPSSLMRIKNKSLTAGVRTPPGARSFGSFLRNGSGISASHWGMRSIPHLCARRNLLPLRSGSLCLSSNQHASRRLHRRFSMDLRNGPVLPLREAFPVQRFSPNSVLARSTGFSGTTGTLPTLLDTAPGSQCGTAYLVFSLHHALWDTGRLCRCDRTRDALTSHLNLLLCRFFPRFGSPFRV